MMGTFDKLLIEAIKKYLSVFFENIPHIMCISKSNLRLNRKLHLNI